MRLVIHRLVPRWEQATQVQPVALVVVHPHAFVPQRVMQDVGTVLLGLDRLQEGLRGADARQRTQHPGSAARHCRGHTMHHGEGEGLGARQWRQRRRTTPQNTPTRSKFHLPGAIDGTERVFYTYTNHQRGGDERARGRPFSVLTFTSTPCRRPRRPRTCP